MARELTRSVRGTIACGLLILAIIALGYAPRWTGGLLGLVSVLSVDMFACLSLNCLAVKSKSGAHTKCFPGLPEPGEALLFLPLFMTTLVVAFAGLYLATQGVIGPTDEPLTDRLDAVYFSVVTMATVGYGDFHAVGATAKLAVMGEILSGFTMLFVFFPILASRLANVG